MNKQLLIGYADLAYIKDNPADLGKAIGESKLWGKGIGFNVALNMIEYGAKELGFKEISRIGFEEYLGKNERLIQYRYDV